MARYRVLVGFCLGPGSDAEVGQEIDGSSLPQWLLRLKVDSGALEATPAAAAPAAEQPDPSPTPAAPASTTPPADAAAPAAEQAAPAAKSTAPAKAGKKES